MSYTVGGAFNTFREVTVDLDSKETGTARTSRDYLFEQLKQLARNDPEFPMSSSSYLNFGSFARRTKIRPLDDIDMMIMFNGRDTIAKNSPDTPYTYWLWIAAPDAPLALFPDDFGYVNSTKLLNKIKRSLAQVPNYGKAEIKKNMQAVVLNLTSYPWVFDVVPAVPVDDGSGGTAYYLIPNGLGDWIRTDPRIDSDNVTRLNKRHNGNFLPTVRLLKYWNGRSHKPKIASYYFETLALKVYEQATTITNFPQAVECFFRNCPAYLHLSCQDPKGLGPDLDADVSWETKNKVSEAMVEAAKHAGYALMYERQSNEKDAIYWWQRVFGSEFPGYG
jgi:hypothetical protein